MERNRRQKRNTIYFVLCPDFSYLTAHTLPYPIGDSHGTLADLPVQPEGGVFDRSCGYAGSIPPPERNWARADISELKGQPLLGQRNRVLSAFVSGQNRKCIPHFSKCVSIFKTQITVAHAVIQPRGSCGSCESLSGSVLCSVSSRRHRLTSVEGSGG